MQSYSTSKEEGRQSWELIIKSESDKIQVRKDKIPLTQKSKQNFYVLYTKSRNVLVKIEE